MDSDLFNATDCTLKGAAKQYLTAFLNDPDAPCSGHGTCQSGLCVCDSGYHGESDMVNLSGYACHVQTLTRQAFWGVALLLWTIMWLINVFALIHKYGEWKRLNRNSSGGKWSGKQPALTYFPFQILVPGSFVVIPMVMATALLKIFTNQAIGVDVPVTLLFSFGSLGSFFVSAHNQGHQFRMLTRGRMMGSSSLAKIVSQFTNGAHVSQVVYALAKLLQVGAISTQESGILSAPVVGLLLANNILTFLYFFMYGVMAHKVMTSVASLLSNASGSTSVGVSKSQLRKVLGFMEETVKRSRVASAAMTLLYVAYSLPWLFGYQTFAYSLALILAFPTYSKQSRLFLASRGGKNDQGTTTNSTNHTWSSNQNILAPMSSNQKLLVSGRDDGKEGSAYEMKSDGRILSANGSFNAMDTMSMTKDNKPAVLESKNPSFDDKYEEDEEESPKTSKESSQWTNAKKAAQKYNVGW